jgi:hypothetical protein
MLRKGALSLAADALDPVRDIHAAGELTLTLPAAFTAALLRRSRRRFMPGSTTCC